MSWVDSTAEIGIGDRVCYSRRYLQSTGQQTGEVPFARGVVTAITALGELRLATIDWGNPDIPERVNVANLAKVTEQGVQDLL